MTAELFVFFPSSNRVGSSVCSKGVNGQTFNIPHQLIVVFEGLEHRGLLFQSAVFIHNIKVVVAVEFPPLCNQYEIKTLAVN